MYKLLLVGLLALATTVATAAPEAGELMSRTDILENADALPVDATLTSGQPDEAVLDVLAESGYSTIVDLRGPDEFRGMDERIEVEERGMQYVPLPVPSKAEISFDNAARLEEILQSSDGPVLVHCGSGNRVGALFALNARRHGASIDEALAAGREAGLTSLEGATREVMEAVEE